MQTLINLVSLKKYGNRLIDENAISGNLLHHKSNIYEVGIDINDSSQK